MLRNDMKHYTQIGAWLTNLVKKKELPIAILRSETLPILVRNDVVSFNYLIVSATNPNDKINFYIKYNQNSRYLNLEMKLYNSTNSTVRYNIDGNKIEYLIIDMYKEITNTIDVNDNPFESHQSIK